MCPAAGNLDRETAGGGEVRSIVSSVNWLPVVRFLPMTFALSEFACG
jgi:hypothetical protein